MTVTKSMSVKIRRSVELEKYKVHHCEVMIEVSPEPGEDPGKVYDELASDVREEVGKLINAEIMEHRLREE